MKATTKTPGAFALCLSLLLAPLGVALADTVVVRPGDTIARIAARELGDKNRYPEICALNQRVVGYDCDSISVGMVLTLPSRAANDRAPAKTAAAGPRSSDRQAPRTKTTLSGDFVAQFSRSGGHALNAANGYTAQQDDDFVRISGYVQNAPSDGIPGVWFKVPSSIEQRASGRTVLVKVLVRAPTPGPVSLTYSRNEIGSREWITKGAGTTFRTLTFTYKVPPANKFSGDYIGILPDPRNARQFVEVAEIAISVLGDPHPSQTGVTPPPPTGKEWTFDTGNEGFVVTNGSITWQPGGTIEVAATGADVILRSPGGLAIPGAENTVVSMRFRVTSFWGDRGSWDGRVYYWTSNHSASASYFGATPEPSLVLNDWRVVRWDMANLSAGDTDWVKSIIDQIRIDLQNSRSEPYGTVEIDWIKVDSN